jgi:CBS-domain-containing membrane protein
MHSDVYTIGPDTTLDDFLNEHLPAASAHSIPVVADDGRYIGVARLADVRHVPRADRTTTTVAERIAALPTAEPAWPLRRALESMQDADLQHIAVVDEDQRFLGVVTQADVAGLDELVARRPRADDDDDDDDEVDAADVVVQIPEQPELSDQGEADSRSGRERAVGPESAGEVAGQPGHVPQDGV